MQARLQAVGGTGGLSLAAALEAVHKHVERPKPFSGKEEDWDHWAWKVRNWIRLLSPLARVAFRLAEDAGAEPIDAAKVAEAGLEQLSAVIYAMVAGLVPSGHGGVFIGYEHARGTRG